MGTHEPWLPFTISPAACAWKFRGKIPLDQFGWRHQGYLGNAMGSIMALAVLGRWVVYDVFGATFNICALPPLAKVSVCLFVFLGIIQRSASALGAGP